MLVLNNCASNCREACWSQVTRSWN